MATLPQAHLGRYQPMVDEAFADLTKKRIVERIWAHDYTVWQPTPTDISNRLGWLTVIDEVIEDLARIDTLVDELRGAGYSRAVLLGMGGATLAAQMLRMTFGVKAGYLNLTILDSIDPATILAHSEMLDPDETLFIISTKSGDTIETIALFKYFYQWMSNTVGSTQAGAHFIAITDPGSSLVNLAQQHNFRAILLSNPQIGGRYSALSHFGMVPTALTGIDIEKLLRSGSTAAQESRQQLGDDAAAWLGVTMAVLAQEGRDKLTMITSPALSHFGAWAEQLIAESTGKQGIGILPIEGEAILSPKYYCADRLFVHLRLIGDNAYDSAIEALIAADQPVLQITVQHLADLGAEFFRWEMAAAIAGHLLHVNPFDQPNLESAKVAAHTLLLSAVGLAQTALTQPLVQSDGISVFVNATSAGNAFNSDFDESDIGKVLRYFLNQATQENADEVGRPYVAIQAFVPATDDISEALHEFRTQIQRRTRLATTVGFGPRFLHSTSQLHKGDAGHGIFIQITADNTVDIAIPSEVGKAESTLTFGTLKDRQARLEYQSLTDHQRNVIRFDLGLDVVAGLEKLAGAVRG